MLPDWLYLLEGQLVCWVSEDHEEVVTWNRSLTFNVYVWTGDELQSVDVFTAAEIPNDPRGYAIDRYRELASYE